MHVAHVPALAVALMLSGCVVPTGPVEVSRFNRAAEGQSYGSGSFTVVAMGWGASQNGGSPISTPYTVAVAREMQRVGYTDLVGESKSDLVVEVTTQVRDAGISSARSPVSVGVGGGTGGYHSGVGVEVGLDIRRSDQQAQGPHHNRAFRANTEAFRQCCHMGGPRIARSKLRNTRRAAGNRCIQIGRSLVQGFPGQ